MKGDGAAAEIRRRRLREWLPESPEGVLRGRSWPAFTLSLCAPVVTENVGWGVAFYFRRQDSLHPCPTDHGSAIQTQSPLKRIRPRTQPTDPATGPAYLSDIESELRD